MGSAIYQGFNRRAASVPVRLYLAVIADFTSGSSLLWPSIGITNQYGLSAGGRKRKHDEITIGYGDGDDCVQRVC